jgi:CubicO group peptidase (beta-lactamase class C family)
MKMNNPKTIAFAITLIVIGFGCVSAQPATKIGPNAVEGKIVNQNFLSEFADKLNEKMKGRSAGYAFTVIANGLIAISRVGGDSRRPPDANPRKMSFADKYNIASVSKTITAAAAMKLLAEKGISLDSPIYEHLPPNWSLGQNTKSITFRQLLTHRSGIRCPTEVTYSAMKQCIAKGIFADDAKTQQYNNTNYALFRILIPRLSGFYVSKDSTDAMASKLYAGAYAHYVQSNVFKPLGLEGIEQKPAAKDPGLAYQFPAPVIAGTDFGDMTETGASRGWVMDSRQLAIFLNGLIYSGRVVSPAAAKRMKDENLGLWPTMVGTKFVSWEHGGYYPAKQPNVAWGSDGEMNSLIINFPNGISVGVIVNSQFVSDKNIPDTIRAVMADVSK